MNLKVCGNCNFYNPSSPTQYATGRCLNDNMIDFLNGVTAMQSCDFFEAKEKTNDTTKKTV